MAEAVAATTAFEATGGSETGFVAPTLPLPERLKYAVLAFMWSKLLLKPIFMYSEAKKYFVSPGESEPDLAKSYPVRASLSVRIFFPPSYDPSTSSAKFPTLLTIHGGGFVIGQAHDNDAWNRAFAKRHSFLVVALDYAKAPAHPFPTAVHDIEALIGCVLADGTLPIDHARVALAGFSAGGNLTLAASQLPSVRERIRAAVPFYPVVDFGPQEVPKECLRRYKPSLGGFRARETDFLVAMGKLFDWAYVSAGQRYDDPLLCPYRARREDLPNNIFIVACEMDLLGPEAWRLACRLAGKRVPGLDEVVGREEPVGNGVLITEGDERFAWEENKADGSRYKWLLVPDTVHGYDQENLVNLAGNDPPLLEDAKIKTTKVIDIVGQWLLDGALKAQA